MIKKYVSRVLLLGSVCLLTLFTTSVSAEETIEGATEETTEEATEETTEEATEEPTEEVTEEPTEEATEETTEEATEEPTEEVTEEPTEEVTEEPTEEATEEPTEEATEETTEEVGEMEAMAVDSGELMLEGLSNLDLGGSLTLDGTVQTVDTVLDPFIIEDGRGAGNGWTLNIKATPLELQAAETVSDAFTAEGEAPYLPEGSFNMSSVEVTAEEGASPVSEHMSISQGGALDTPGGLDVVTADKGGGMGRYEISNLSLSLVFEPQFTAAGTYSSTLTFTLVSGP